MDNGYMPAASPQNQKQDVVFGLDIGTRSVVGVMGVVHEDGFEALDFAREYHGRRAMRDGQIEDIAMVVGVARKVKEALEQRNKVTFQRVSIAAAGRSLKTVKVLYEQTLETNEEISEETLLGVEYSALGQAIDQFQAEDKKHEGFFCVGYSVIRYRLDDYTMSNLVGHRGTVVEVEMIAAFLPHNVVEGLYSAMRKLDLEVESLTLEPMAAIHVVVPKDIRLLNIAIVDIGAGTSDIAISKNGGIIGYDMVTIAGDELTEQLMQHYITDFETAETIKIALSSGVEEVTFSNVLGTSQTLSIKEVYEKVYSTVRQLADTIAQRIVENNGGSPVAVFLVGGGSQIPGLCKLLAEAMDMDESRVTIGGKQGLKYVKMCAEELNSPEFVTPIGIGAISSEHKGKDFFSITVNGNKIMLLRQGEIKVIDAILLAGLKPSRLIGTPSSSVGFTINGEKRSYRESDLLPGELKVNGQTASVNSIIQRGDEVTVIFPRSNPAPTLTLAELKTEFPKLRIAFRKQNIELAPTALVNERFEGDDYGVGARDAVEIRCVKTLGDLCKTLDVDTEAAYEINGKAALLTDMISTGDVIDVAEEPVEAETKIMHICVNGEWLSMPVASDHQAIFVDLLNYVEVAKQEPRGVLLLKLNGKDAAYTDLISDGDFADIRWEE